ncbi:hypothetical protein ACH0CG_03955 [Microbacterium sp. 179-I 1D1 NHS]|uniref:hypothetical protein n=1 Tax=Microbacterium sp. 179-I 1D1 NHS TaxID=3374298 RepID=UPI0038795901
MSTGPDWTIRIPGSEADQLTEQQRALLNLVEAELPASRGEEHDLSALEARVAPLIRALLSSGLTAEQIADNSRLRPAFVTRITGRGA